MPQESENISPQDRDMMIRTIIGEASNQPPVGQAAVANVILNRLRSGQYGDTPTQVVLAPNQFGPWQTRAQELRAIPPTSNIYNDVGRIVDGVLSGQIKDPTGGSTHFLNEDIVRQRRGGTLPDWAQGQGLRIGAHTFFKPDQAMAQQTPDYLSDFMASKSAPVQSGAPAAQSPDVDYLGEFLNAAPKVASQGAVSSPQNNDAYSIPIPAPTDHPEGYYGGRQHVTISKPPSEFMERTVKPLMNLPSGIATVAGDYLTRLRELAGQNASTVGTGLSDIAQGKSATGVGEVGLGALGYLGSPIQAIDVPLTKMTGNPDFGEKAAMLIPGGFGGRVANAARPTVSALTDIIKDIGAENLPGVVKRLESNPNLTLMDVAPAIRGNAAGLATDPRNVPAMSHLNQFQKQRMAGRGTATTNAFEDVLGPTPNVKDTLDTIKAQAQKTGKELIEPAVQSAGPVDVTSIIQNLDKQLPPSTLTALKSGQEPPALPNESKRIWALRERLRGDTPEGSPVVVDADTAHELQKELRLSSSDPQFGYQARQVRNGLVSAIDKATDKNVSAADYLKKQGFSDQYIQKLGSGVEGEASTYGWTKDLKSGPSYKAALKQYADDKAVDEAFKHGFNLFSNPTGAENALANHPDMWKAWAQDASKAELDAARKGAMIGARTRIANMRKGIDIPEGGFTHERLSAIVGPDQANKIVQTLNDWRDIAETDNLLTKNSATAVRQAGQAARAVRSPDPNAMAKWTLPVLAGIEGFHATGSPLWATGAVLGAKGAGKLASVAGRMHDVASNDAYAQWASAMGSKKQDLIDVLRQASARANPASNAEKLMNLLPSSVLQALPR